jgi:sugar (pentulose or hexulose) kinase
MYSFYLGLDLHLKRTYAVLMDNNGKVIDEQRVPNNEIEQYLEEVVPQNMYAVLEATRNWPFMYDLMNERLARVELAHPKELKAIASAVGDCVGDGEDTYAYGGCKDGGEGEGGVD